jgi:phage terminase large subunit-like protein
MEAQEIRGRMMEEYAGALWNREQLDEDRIRDPAVLSQPPAERLAALNIVRVAVGIDPSTWIPPIGGGDEATEGGKGTETGVVTAGIDRRSPPHIYVLEDSSGRLSAEEWASRAARDYHTWRAAWVVPETNIGGPMTLATLALTDPSVTVYRKPGSKKPGVHAALGKRARAEPVALLSDQGRFHIVGSFPALESTLVTWDPTEVWSPDRLDAMVWAAYALQPWRKRGSSGVGGRGNARQP